MLLRPLCWPIFSPKLWAGMESLSPRLLQICCGRGCIHVGLSRLKLWLMCTIFRVPTSKLWLLHIILCLQLGVYRLSQYQLTHWDSYGSLNPSYKDDKCNEKSYGQVQVDVQQCSLVERLPVWDQMVYIRHGYILHSVLFVPHSVAFSSSGDILVR